MLNVDTKLISQALSERIRNTLPCIVSEIQTAYVNLRFTSEGGSLIDELLEFCDMFDNEGFLVTINIEKTLNFFDHNFLITILEKFVLEMDSSIIHITKIQWIKILLKNQESCIINAGKTSQYF